MTLFKKRKELIAERDRLGRALNASMRTIELQQYLTMFIFMLLVAAVIAIVKLKKGRL